MEKKKVLTISVIVLGVITLLSLVTAGYFFFKARDLRSQEITNEALIEDVSEIMVLPNETPVIATIENIEEVKDQPFFKNAQNGDKVLAFIQSKKAILYRPSTNQIIEVGPILISGDN